MHRFIFIVACDETPLDQFECSVDAPNRRIAEYKLSTIMNGFDYMARLIHIMPTPELSSGESSAAA